MKRAAYFFCAPAVCLALFWRTLFTWFRTDDFGLLGLASTVHDIPSAGHALFHPIAQGTVRVLSDRLFYIVLYSLFGIAAAPFHIAILLTWFVALGLAAEIGSRIAGSRAAGLLAALLWTVSKVMVGPLAWAALYEVVLLAALALAALYCRIRWLETRAPGWQAGEWILYLAGFGAQEGMVMYPAAAALYTWAVARHDIFKKGERGVFLLFIPSAIFAAVDLLLIPKIHTETYYRLAVDARLPHTLATYLRMAIGPENYASRKILLPVLGAFTLWRLWRRDTAALFCVGWFLLWLAPVLPLPNHISEYYLAAPLAGLAWLGGWALVAAFRSGRATGLIAAGCLTLYLANALPAIRDESAWYRERTSRMRLAFRGMEETAYEHPGAGAIFNGVDNDLFQTGFQDNPYRLAGLSGGYLAPGTEEGIVAREDLGGIKGLTISVPQAVEMIRAGQVRVLQIADGPPRDITHSFEAIARAEFLAEHRDFVDVGRPVYAADLGPTWNRIENGFRWMPKSATVQLAGPSSTGQKLYVTGYGPSAALASGPVSLRFRASGVDLGTTHVIQPDRPFQCAFALPDKLVGAYAIEISIEVGKTFREPGDGRDLGMAFGTFAVR
ncbi:MAG TPA: hypothetical protein VIY49_34485 [Bryobacteraceae bacterium]